MARNDDRHPDGPHEVLTALPHARPTRRSAKRDAGRSAAGESRAAAKGATTRSRSAGKAKSAGERAGTAKQAAAGARRAGRKAAPERAAPEASGPTVPPAGYATPRGGDATHEPLGRGELVTTAVEAVGELAQFGVTVGVQGLRSVLRRLPRP